jgi:hypothetical protein
MLAIRGDWAEDVPGRATSGGHFVTDDAPEET